MEKSNLGDSGVAAFVVAHAFSGKKYKTGLSGKPVRESFQSAIPALSALAEADSIHMDDLSIVRDGAALLELYAIPQSLHRPPKYRDRGRYQK